MRLKTVPVREGEPETYNQEQAAVVNNFGGIRPPQNDRGFDGAGWMEYLCGPGTVARAAVILAEHQLEDMALRAPTLAKTEALIRRVAKGEPPEPAADEPEA